jgi:hypothetical protein
MQSATEPQSRDKSLSSPQKLIDLMSVFRSLPSASITHEEASEAAELFPDGWGPIYLAMADVGLGLVYLGAAGDGFLATTPEMRGMLILLGDALGGGPEYFDWRMRALLAVVDVVVIVDTDPVNDHFTICADAAARGKVIAMITTKPAQRGTWLRVVHETAPDAAVSFFSGGNFAGWANEIGTA